jgi:hypothetical protein
MPATGIMLFKEFDDVRMPPPSDNKDDACAP